jgi:hypothetical protein
MVIFPLLAFGIIRIREDRKLGTTEKGNFPTFKRIFKILIPNRVVQDSSRSIDSDVNDYDNGNNE